MVAIWLMTYYPPWEILLWALYMGFWIMECKSASSRLTGKQMGIIAMLWQLPPYIFLLLMHPWWSGQIAFSHYSIFLLHLWHTPFLPLFAYATPICSGGKPLFYYLYLWLTPAISLTYILLGLLFKLRWKEGPKNGRR